MSRKNRVLKAVLAVLVSTSLLFMSGCVGVDQENKTQLEIKADGRIVQTIVDDITYDITGEELESYTNENITKYQTASDTISLERCRVSNGKVNLIINYGNTNAYSAFNNVKCFLGTVKEAYDAGFDMNRTFKTVNGVQIPYFALVPLCTDCMVLIIEEPVTVKLPGQLFIVSDGVQIEDDGTIRVAENPDTTLPETLQTTTIEPVFMIYKVK